MASGERQGTFAQMPANGHLPALMVRYLKRALPPGTSVAQHVRVTQTGQMFRNPGSRPMRFTAIERLAVDRVAFSWEARFPIAPLLSLNVRDGYSHGSGMLRVRVLGVPLQSRSSEEIDLGEAFRYLAELPWAPYAIGQNQELDWRQVDASHVEVATMVGARRPAVSIEFDDTGDIVRCFADARPRDFEGESVPTPWGGQMSEYKTLGGMRMPTRGEVYWELPEGRFVYWRGEIRSAQALPEPFEPG